jgi:hypothetical protein
MEFVIYTDESDKEGDYFSNFYGGVLVRSTDLSFAIERLEAAKAEQNLHGEIKWTKVTANYLDKYIAMIDVFFELIAADQAKVRIMFTNNSYVPTGLSNEQLQTEYQRLYYQFIKHSFGLQFSHCEHDGPKRVRLNIDQMPTNNEETAQFKSYVVGLQSNPNMRQADVHFDAQQIAEVSSHDHVLLQCLDIVLGSMSFRLNNKHKMIPEGKRRRGKKTVAKEKLYKHILKRIREIYPNFNVGESTGKKGSRENFWRHRYRHWKMIPKNHQRDESKFKP